MELELTQEAFDVFRDTALQAFREVFVELGELAPITVYLATHDPNTGMPLDQPGIVQVGAPPFAGAETKDCYERELRDTARVCKPIAVVAGLEAWTIDQTHPDLVGDWKRVKRLAETYAGRFEECRYSKEVIYAPAEHGPLKINQMWMATITRPDGPDGKPVLGEWELIADDNDCEASGRFVHLLRPYSGNQV